VQFQRRIRPSRFVSPELARLGRDRGSRSGGVRIRSSIKPPIMTFSCRTNRAAMFASSLSSAVVAIVYLDKTHAVSRRNALENNGVAAGGRVVRITASRSSVGWKTVLRSATAAGCPSSCSLEINHGAARPVQLDDRIVQDRRGRDARLNSEGPRPARRPASGGAVILKPQSFTLSPVSTRSRVECSMPGLYRSGDIQGERSHLSSTAVVRSRDGDRVGSARTCVVIEKHRWSYLPRCPV